jgi:twinkle protein
MKIIHDEPSQPTDPLAKYLPAGFTPNSKDMHELIADVYSEMLNPVPSRKTGYTNFDELTGGFRAREFSILCGATGVGKTTLVANLALALMKQGAGVFVASVETGHNDFIRRILSTLAGKDYNTGDPVPLHLLKRVHADHSVLLEGAKLSLSLHENRFSVENLMAEILWHVKNKGTNIAFIDNLNFFLEVTRAADQIVEMDRVIHELIIFCKQVDVHVVMVMHPKKTEHGRVESEFDIKGSSTAVQEAHNVLLFNRPHPQFLQEGKASEFDRELKVAKMRRRGKHVGSRLIFKGVDGVKYQEGDVF